MIENHTIVWDVFERRWMYVRRINVIAVSDGKHCYSTGSNAIFDIVTLNGKIVRTL